MTLLAGIAASIVVLALFLQFSLKEVSYEDEESEFSDWLDGPGSYCRSSYDRRRSWDD